MANAGEHESVSLASTCAEARQDYLKSAAGFQKAAGFRDSSGSSALRLDGERGLQERMWMCNHRKVVIMTSSSEACANQPGGKLYCACTCDKRNEIARLPTGILY